MERITVKEAAHIMGVSEQFIRIGMQRGKLPIGQAVKMSSVWTYYISPKLFNEFVGTKKSPPAATDGEESACAVKQKQKGRYEHTTI